MIQIVRGDLLADDADVLVCTTNTRGVMGKGLALAFARRWPGIVQPYAADCRAGKLKGGSSPLYDLPVGDDLFGHLRRRQWAAFCTKEDWRRPSEYRWVEDGLQNLKAGLVEAGHKSVALPPLGCGLGGLSWIRVLPMIEQAFAATAFEVRVYAP